MTRTEFPRQFHIVDAIGLAIVPIFARIFSNIHMGPSGIDAWFYYGCGTNYLSILQRFGWTYYASRLSWNLIIGIYFSIFDPHVALFLLGLTASALGSISLYAILRNYYSRMTAFLSAFALAANPWYLGATFWLYVDGPAIAVSLYCIAAFIHGLRNRRQLAFCLSGLALTVGVNMHPIVLILVVPCLGLILLAERPAMTNGRQLTIALANFCATAATTMFVLCVFAWLAFGNFWFFSPSITSAEWVVSGGWHEWVLPFSTWIPGATAFLIPIGVLLGGAIVFARDAFHRQLGRDAWIFGYAAFLGGCVLISDGILQAGRLQHSYYFIYLWIPTFLLLGATIARLSNGIGLLLPFAAIGAGLAALGTLVFASDYWHLHMEYPEAATVGAYVVLAGLIVAFGGAVWFGQTDRSVTKMIGILAGVTFISTASAVDNRTDGEYSRADRVLWQSPTSMLDFGATVDAQRFIESNVDRSRRLLIWYDGGSRAKSELIAINSTFLYAYALLNTSMPNLAETDLQKMNVPSAVVLLSADREEAYRAIGVLRKRGFVERVSANTEVGPTGKRIGVWIVEARSATDAKDSAND